MPWYTEASPAEEETVGSKHLWLTLGLALALLVVMIAAAAELPSSEATLTSGGSVREISRGSDGNLYVSEDRAGKVWVVQPSGEYIAYTVDRSPLDAKPDSTGSIWWTDGTTTFGRINADGETQTTWDFGMDHNLWGLAIGASDIVWMTDWSSTTGPRLYSFAPQATELCTYTLPGGTYSTYIVYQSGALWLGNRFADRIMRFDPLAAQSTWWTIPDNTSWPLGLTVDRQGNVWWADLGLDALARLAPTTGEMTRFDLPVEAGTNPQMVEIRGDKVWFTGGSAGTVGLLDSRLAQGQTSTMASGSGSWSRTCAELGDGTTAPLVATEAGSLAWTAGSLAPTYEADGWTVYRLPSGAEPYGLASVSDYLWVTDPGRDSLHRLSLPVFRVFLPLVSRQ